MGSTDHAVANARTPARELFQGAALSYAAILLAIASGIFVTPMLVRYLGRSDYGIFTLATSVVTLLSFDLGLNSAVARFVAHHEARGDRAATRATLQLVRAVYLMLDLVFAVAVIVAWKYSTRFFPALSPTEQHRFQTALPLSAVVMLFAFPLQPANGTLQGLSRFVALKGSDVAWRVASVLLTVVCVTLRWGLVGLVLTTALVSLGVSLFRTWVCFRAGAWTWQLSLARGPLRREVAGYTSWSLFVALGQRLIVTIMPAILAARSGAHAAAGFGIVAMLEGYVWLVANAVNGLFLPVVTKLVHSSDHDRLQDLFERVGKFQTVMVGAIIGGFTVAGRAFLEIWLGSGYQDLFWAILLIIIPSWFIYAQEVAMSTIIAQGEIRYRAVATACAGVISTCLAFVLAPRWGVLGAAIAVSLANVVGNVVFMNIVYLRITPLDIPRFITHVYARAAAGVFLCSVPVLALQSTWDIASFGLLAASASLFALPYAAVSWLFTLNDHERAWVRATIARRGGNS